MFLETHYERSLEKYITYVLYEPKTVIITWNSNGAHWGRSVLMSTPAVGLPSRCPVLHFILAQTFMYPGLAPQGGVPHSHLMNFKHTSDPSSMRGEKKDLLTPPTKSQMIKRGVKRLQWSEHKGINMESWNDLQDNVWTNNTSKVVITSKMHWSYTHTHRAII